MTMWNAGDRYPLSEKAVAAYRVFLDAERLALAAYEAWRAADRADLEAYRAQYPADADAPEPEIRVTRRHGRK